jgi:hypothetical protein
MNYDKKKIIFRKDANEKFDVREKKKRGIKKGYQGQRKVKPKSTRTIQVFPEKNLSDLWQYANATNRSASHKTNH